MPEATARIVRFHSLGAAEVLKLDTLPLPEPGPGEVRLRVKAIGLNRAEVSFREGRYLIQPTLPSKLGYEASGIVEALGEGVDPAWLNKTASTVPSFHLGQFGVYGEVAVVPAGSLAEYPARLSFVEAASIWMQYLTAWGAILDQGKLTKDDFVVITAASSSVGLAAIQIVKAEGATSIATTRTSAKRDELLALGADHVIATQEEDLPARVRQITAGKGARILFDPVAGPFVKQLADAASESGILFEYGALSSEPTPLPLFHVIRKHLTVKGYSLFEIVANPSVFAAGKQYLFDRLQSGIFHPRIDKTFPLDQIVEAQRYMESNAQVGKIVVTV